MEAHVTVKLYATLSRYRPENGEQFPVAPGTTVADLIETLELPSEEVRLIFVDGRRTDRTRELSGGERIGFFPPVGGG